MWPSATAAFVGLTTKIEGCLAWLYLDVKGLCTVAIGDLVDPLEMALALPFVQPNGMMASAEEITAAWQTVKARQELARMGGGAFESLTTIRLMPEGIDTLVRQRRAANEAILIREWPDFLNWPADAQLGLHSMAWAAGAAFYTEFPKFTAAARAGDWATCAGPRGDASADPSKRGEAWLENNGKPGPNPANPGLHPRNLDNKTLFQNAADAVARGADPSVLYWPGSVPAVIPVAQLAQSAILQAADEIPEIPDDVA